MKQCCKTQTGFRRTSSFYFSHDWCETRGSEVCPRPLLASVSHPSWERCFWKRKVAETSVIVGSSVGEDECPSISPSVTHWHLLIEFQTEAERRGWDATLNYVSQENGWTFTQCWPRRFTSKSETHTSTCSWAISIRYLKLDICR